MLQATTLTGSVELKGHDIDRLRRSLTGQLLLPGDDAYDAARAIWNRMIDRRPALIARCAGVGDIVAALRFAREHDLLLSVRGGGHNVTGSAVCDGGIMIDLCSMKGTRIDPGKRVAVAEPGLTWGEFDTATQRFGLATTGGIVSTTGVAGLTLGGGQGWLMRKHGLTCDNLLSVNVVTADGRLLRASAEENSDLFWGVCGGGGNFGIVTAFEFQLHPVSRVLSGVLLYPMSRAKEVLEFYREHVVRAPDELTADIIITTWFDGNPVVAIVPCYSGPVETGERVLRPFRKLKAPIVDGVRPMAYAELQTMFDTTNPPGAWYYKSGYFDADKVKADSVIDVLIDQCAFPSPTPLSRIVIEHLGGAMARVGPEDTAFSHRAAPFDLIVIAGGFKSEEAQKNIRWARGAWDAMRPFLSGGIYVNYLGADAGTEGVKAAYGPAYERLAALKDKYDPGNVFRQNHNIGPSLRRNTPEGRVGAKPQK